MSDWFTKRGFKTAPPLAAEDPAPTQQDDWFSRNGFATAQPIDVAPAAPPRSSRTVGGTLADIGVTALKGFGAIPEAVVGLGDIASGGRAGKFLKEGLPFGLSYDPAADTATMDALYSPAQREAFDAVQNAEGIGGKFKAAITNPSTIGHAVLESAPLMLAGGAVGRGVGMVAPKLGAMAGGAIGEGVVAAGSAAEGTRQESADGYLTPKQSALAVATGASTSVLGLVGGKIAKAAGLEDIDSLLAGMSSPAARKELTKAVIYGAVQEGGLEELPQSVVEQVLANEAAGRPWEHGVDQAAVMGALSGGVMGAGAQLMPSGKPPIAQPPPQPAPQQAAPPITPTGAPPISPVAPQPAPTGAPPMAPQPTPDPAQSGPTGAGGAVTEFGKGLTAGLYERMWKELTGELTPVTDKPPLAEQLVQRLYAQGHIKTPEQMREVVEQLAREGGDVVAAKLVFQRWSAPPIGVDQPRTQEEIDAELAARAAAIQALPQEHVKERPLEAPKPIHALPRVVAGEVDEDTALMLRAMAEELKNLPGEAGYMVEADPDATYEAVMRQKEVTQGGERYKNSPTIIGEVTNSSGTELLKMLHERGATGNYRAIAEQIVNFLNGKKPHANTKPETMQAVREMAAQWVAGWDPVAQKWKPGTPHATSSSPIWGLQEEDSDRLKLTYAPQPTEQKIPYVSNPERKDRRKDAMIARREREGMQQGGDDSFEFGESKGGDGDAAPAPKQTYDEVQEQIDQAEEDWKQRTGKYPTVEEIDADPALTALYNKRDAIGAEELAQSVSAVDSVIEKAGVIDAKERAAIMYEVYRLSNDDDGLGLAQSFAGQYTAKQAADVKGSAEQILKRYLQQFPDAFRAGDTWTQIVRYAKQDNPQLFNELVARSERVARAVAEYFNPDLAPAPPLNQKALTGKPPISTDVNEFGEAQARLPEAGDVREQNIETPELTEAPFSLANPIDTPTQSQGGLFGEEAPKTLTGKPPIKSKKDYKKSNEEHRAEVAAKEANILERLERDGEVRAALPGEADELVLTKSDKPGFKYKTVVMKDGKVYTGPEYVGEPRDYIMYSNELDSSHHVLAEQAQPALGIDKPATRRPPVGQPKANMEAERPRRNQSGTYLLEDALSPAAQQNLDRAFKDPTRAKELSFVREAMEVYDRVLNGDVFQADDLKIDRDGLSKAILDAAERYFTTDRADADAFMDAHLDLRVATDKGRVAITGRDDIDDLDENNFASAHDAAALIWDTLDPRTASFDTEEFNTAFGEVEFRKPADELFPPVKERVLVRVKTKNAPAEMPQEEADAIKQSWKDEAKRIGKEEDNSNRVILSLFDRTGQWSQPYKDAGYNVITFDLENGQDMMDFASWMGQIEELISEGNEIAGVLAAPPCLSYNNAGRHAWKSQHDTPGARDKKGELYITKKYGQWAVEMFDKPIDYANTLVAVVKLIVQQTNPPFYAMENPAGPGRFADQNHLPESRLEFDPNAYGDPYTKQTSIWGEFNPHLPTARVKATKGSIITHNMGGGDLRRSETPEGFAYAFFMANHESAVAQEEQERDDEDDEDEDEDVLSSDDENSIYFGKRFTETDDDRDSRLMEKRIKAGKPLRADEVEQYAYEPDLDKAGYELGDDDVWRKAESPKKTGKPPTKKKRKKNEPPDPDEVFVSEERTGSMGRDFADERDDDDEDIDFNRFHNITVSKGTDSPYHLSNYILVRSTDKGKTWSVYEYDAETPHPKYHYEPDPQPKRTTLAEGLSRADALALAKDKVPFHRPKWLMEQDAHRDETERLYAANGPKPWAALAKDQKDELARLWAESERYNKASSYQTEKERADSRAFTDAYDKYSALYDALTRQGYNLDNGAIEKAGKQLIKDEKAAAKKQGPGLFDEAVDDADDQDSDTDEDYDEDDDGPDGALFDAAADTAPAADPLATRKAEAGPKAPSFPEGVEPIELPEALEIVEQLLGEVPTVRNIRARGQFDPMDGRITLNPMLFKQGQERQLSKTLLHELGHGVDWLSDHNLKRGNLLGRLRSLNGFMKSTFQTPAGTIKLAVVRQELLGLSKAWRPWDRKTASASEIKYRDSGVELYADALSALFIDPKYVSEVAPVFYNEWLRALHKKPDVLKAYESIQAVIRAGRADRNTLIDRRLEAKRKGYDEGDQKAIEQQQQKQADLQDSRKNIWERLKLQHLDKHYWADEKVKGLRSTGVQVNQYDDPFTALGERNYMGGQQKGWVQRNIQPLLETLTKASIDWKDLGVYLELDRVIHGDRGNAIDENGDEVDADGNPIPPTEIGQQLANPGGTPENHEESMARLKEQLGPEKTRILERAVAKFRATMDEILDAGYRAGLYTPASYAKMKANPAYATFQVIEYMNANGPSWQIYQQKGTLKKINNPANATTLKMLATLRMTEHQKVKTKVFRFLGKHFPGEIQQAKVTVGSDGRRIVQEPEDRTKWALVKYMEKGKLEGKYVSPIVADSLNNESIGHTLATVTLMRRLNSGYFRPAFTSMNLGFQTVNIARDMFRYWKNMPGTSLAKMMVDYWRALPMAKVRAFGLSKKPKAWELQAQEDLLQAEEGKFLSITFNDLMKGRQFEETEIEDILSRTSAKMGTPPISTLKKVVTLKPIFDFIKNMGDFIETMPKAAAMSRLKGNGQIRDIGPKDRSMIRRKIGSPDYLAGGTAKPIFNEIFLFSNAILQAWRSDIEVAMDLKKNAKTGMWESPSGFWWKTMAVNVMPKFLMMAALGGMLDRWWWGDEYRQMLEKISEYDKTNYLVIPIRENEKGEVQYLRLPQDDTGRFIGGLFWKGLRMARGDRDVLETTAQVVSYTLGNMPAPAPLLGLAGDAAQMLAGQNPYDDFRGRNIFTDDEWKAKDATTMKKLGQHLFQNLGGTAVSNPLNRWIRTSDYGATESLREAGTADEKIEARKRNQMKAELAPKIEFYANLPEDDRTRGEAFRMAREAVEKVYADRPKDERDRRTNDVRGRIMMGALRKTADPLTEQLSYTQTNSAKRAIIAKGRKSMDKVEFDQWLTEAARHAVISKSLAAEIRRQPNN